jgi:tetratricopeptide (TPR) repeat protein
VNAPSVADFHYVMGALETRAGDLERGRPHLARAVALAPSRDALRMLSAIDRQRGDVASALISVQGIQALTQKEGDLVGQARASLLAFELHRDAGRNDDAEAALRPALEQALDARHSARTGTEVAIAETLLAEVLEQYGALDAAERAAERAFDSSQHDLGRLTTALLDASRRALTHGDVATARDVLRRAVDAKLDHDDLVYVALWTRLTEQGAKVTSDGSAVEAVMMLEPETAWTRALRDWGRNSLTGEQLVARAGSAVEKTEAQFYILMSAYASGDASTSVAPLSEVAKSPTIELIEVRIARDLIARANNAPTPQLPSGIELP